MSKNKMNEIKVSKNNTPITQNNLKHNIGLFAALLIAPIGYYTLRVIGSIFVYYNQRLLPFWAQDYDFESFIPYDPITIPFSIFGFLAVYPLAIVDMSGLVGHFL